MKTYNLSHRLSQICISMIGCSMMLSSFPTLHAADLCDARVRKPSSIERSCSYTIDPAKINAFIAQYPASAGVLEPIADNPPQGKSPGFGPAIKTMRDASYQYRGPTVHDAVYVFNGGCKYTPKYASYDVCTNEATTFPPLIDRIKPTVSIDVGFGKDRQSLTEKLLDQEANTKSLGEYLAGTGTISVTMTDAHVSNFSPNNVGFDGISGISAFSITVCRTKTHTNMEIDPNCEGNNLKKKIYASGATSLGYNPTGKINTSHLIIDKIDFDDTAIDGMRVAGEYQIFVKMIDEAGNTNSGTVTFNIYPQSLDTTRTKIEKYDNPNNTSDGHVLYTTSGSSTAVSGLGLNGPKFSNALDKQTYKVSIFDVYGNPVYKWNLKNFRLSATGIYLDDVAKTGSSALFISSGSSLSNTPQTFMTDENGAVTFSVISYTPGMFTEQFSFEYSSWNKRREEIAPIVPNLFPTQAQTGTFLQILTGAIELYTTNRVDLGTSNDIRLGFHATTSTVNPSITSFTISNFMESLVSLAPDNFQITSTGTFDKNFVFVPSYPATGYLSGAVSIFTPEQVGTAFSKSLQVESWPYINLTFAGGQSTRYYVNGSQDTFGSGIVFGTGELNRIYIEGNKQTTGKGGFVDVSASIASTNSADVRNTIHKNVGILLRNRPNPGIVNRVKYVQGDTKSSELGNIDDWDTVIIQGGNLTIDEDINVPQIDDIPPHKGIIVLASDITNAGGYIYIQPQVQFIGATLYADESIQSIAKNTTNLVFAVSNSTRTKELEKQLVFYGGIFSKNTVGGAVKANNDGKYILPWGKDKTGITLDVAVQFDLAFLRMDNKNKNLDLSHGHSEYVVVLTDLRSMTDPLPGFDGIIK